MLFWRFVDSGANLGEPLPHSYNYFLVLLSIVVASSAGYAALEVVGRMGTARIRRYRNIWLAAGAVAMGSGVWAMHFIGMLAFSVDATINYSLFVTLVSMLPAVFASAIALHYMDRKTIEFWRLNVGGLFMALGIGGMHYTGMEAMRMDTMMGYTPGLFVLSIVVAHVLATIALFIKFSHEKLKWLPELPRKAGSAVAMGLAVSGMHYTAMAAVKFYPQEMDPVSAIPFAPILMGLTIALVTSFIIGLAIASTIVDRHMAAISASLLHMERRAGLIIETSPEAFISMDEQGRITDWNPKAEETFGWSKGEVVGKVLSETIIPPDYRKTHETGRKRYLETGESTFLNQREELEGLHRDGRVFPVEMSVSALKTSDSYQFNAFLHDISERKRAEEALRSAMADAEQAAQAKSEFLATMSHEIRTPMNGVMGMTGLLLDTDLNAEQREFAQTIRNSADVLLTIINDILDFSKIEAHKLDLEVVSFDLRTAIEDALELIAPKAEEKHIELLCQIDPRIPRTVRGDPGRLRQILLNLLSNAAKFTNEGEISVKVVVDSDKPIRKHEKFSVRFVVSDTGIGIPANRLDAIFDSFTQADSSTTRQFGGTGLGLAISKRLAELHGGTIGVESGEGEGSDFWFTIELEECPDAVDLPLPDLEDVKHHRVLIIDDNETNRLVLQTQLEHFGLHDTEVASDGEAGELLLRSAANEGRPFTVALVDYMMPRMDGEAFGITVKNDPAISGTKLILLVSGGKRGDAKRFQDIGYSAYLVKPVKQDLLIECLGLVLQSKSVAERKAPEAIVTQYTVSESHGRRQARILIAEDNIINQKVTQSMLGKLGYRSDVVANGHEALKAIESIPYSLVLMDCQMPDMDGFEATAAIRALDGRLSKLPIVAMTANAMKEDRQRCLDAGMDDYISKPVDRQVLAEKLAHYLSHKELGQETSHAT